VKGRVILAVAAWLVVGSSCTDRVEQPPLERETFVRVYAEIQLLEAAHRQRMLQAPQDLNFKALRDSALAKFGASDSAFVQTYRFWYSRPDALSDVLDEVIAAVDSLEIQADQREKNRGNPSE
jgi:hypothetical protein